MDSLNDLLSQYSRQEPEEIVAIKRYILETFKAAASVGVQGDALVITVKSAPLANALRLRMPAIKAAANTEKRLIFRIG